MVTSLKSAQETQQPFDFMAFTIHKFKIQYLQKIVFFKLLFHNLRENTYYYPP